MKTRLHVRDPKIQKDARRNEKKGNHPLEQGEKVMGDLVAKGEILIQAVTVKAVAVVRIEERIGIGIEVEAVGSTNGNIPRTEQIKINGDVIVTVTENQRALMLMLPAPAPAPVSPQNMNHSYQNSMICYPVTPGLLRSCPIY